MTTIRKAPEWKHFNLAVAVVFLTLAALFPLTRPPLDAFLDDCILALAYVVMALGLNIVVGFAGLLDLGYVAFYAFGAYSVGWFASDFYSQVNGEEGIHILVSGFAEKLPGIHINFLLILLVAIGFAALAGIVIGLPTLRLRGDYIAIVTLAFGEIIGRFAVNGTDINIEGYKLTNGRQAISPVDQIHLPFLKEFDSAFSLRGYYWFILGMVAFVLFVNFRLRDSRLGRAWIAIREDEVAAASMGVPLVKTKLLAYATGGALGGLAAGAPAMYRAGRNAVSGATMPGMGSASTIGIPGRQAAAADRVAAKIEGATQQGTRIKQGFLEPEEAARLQMPLTEGDAWALSARSRPAAEAGDQLRMREEKLRSDPVFGAKINETRDAQKVKITQLAKERAGITGEVDLTPAVIGENLIRMGKQFDDYARAVGDVPAGTVQAGFKATLDDVTEEGVKSVLSKVATDLDNVAAKNGGIIPADDLMRVRSRLNTLAAKGAEQGNYSTASNATDMIKSVDQAIQDSIPADSTMMAEFAKLRGEYRITKALMKPGAVDAGGQVNPLSLKNRLGRTNASYKSSTFDEFKRALDTVAFLQQRTVPSSGTAERLLANPARAGINLVKGGGYLSAGGIGVGTLLD